MVMRWRQILMLSATAGVWHACGDVLYEDGIAVLEESQRCEVEQAIDLRAIFPVKERDNDPALRGISYSARGWRPEVQVDDSSRTATIVATPGTLIDGKFSANDTAVTVLPAAQGEGTVDWTPTSIKKVVYQLMHTALKGSSRDELATCYGYLDFTHCDLFASQSDVEVAVLDGITHRISVMQDVNYPWQPIDSAVPGSGVTTDVGLFRETTTTAFSFKGCGTLHYKYMLQGGILEVVVNGEPLGTLSAADDWRTHTMIFQDYGMHNVSFVYTATGYGHAALCGVRWEESAEAHAQVAKDDMRVDMRKGVRKVKRFEEVLPFTYSSTNWIDETLDVTASSCARVTIVRLNGTDPDVTKWTEEVPGTFRTLYNHPGEGDVRWRPKSGVWKAGFDIINDNMSIHSEESFFDLRNAKGPGFLLMVF